nr:hypothetical protein [Tanacetum cinerariifolium]
TNKCLSGKSIGYDSLRLSQAQILWGMYHKKNVDFAYLLWEDFMYQVEHKDVKKSNEMYYPRFTKVIVNFFMTRDQSIPRRNKYGAILPVELTNEAIKNLESYKEYYAIALGAEHPKTKASVRKKQSSSDTIVPAKGKRLKTSAKWINLPRRSDMLSHPKPKINESMKVVIRLQSDRLRDKAQVENEDFFNKLDENIQKIIKEQVKEQVKVQVSKIFLKVEKIVNEQLKAEVLTRLSNSSKTSYAIAADLSELELKKILIDKMKSNKSIHISDEQKNLYKALVDAYECDKLILDTYGDTVTLKDDEMMRIKTKNPKCYLFLDKPSTGSNWGSKRRRAGKEPESTSAPKEKTSKTSGKSTEGSKSHDKTASESAPAEEPMHTTQDLEEPAH